MEIPFCPIQLASLAKQHGTPLWVYSAEKIRENIAKLRCFDVIRYAQKAASNLSILRLMREEGVVVDAVSLGEFKRSLQAGYEPTRRNGVEGVIYTADVIDFPALNVVLAERATLNAGSLDMLRRVGQHSPGNRVWVRINPGFGHGHSNKTNTGGPQSKHGIWSTDFPQVLRIVEEFGLKLVGVHMHIGSGVDYGHLEKVCDSMTSVILACDAKRLPHLEAISTGGGLTVPYKKDDPIVDIAHYFGLWDDARKRIAQHLDREIHLEIEPGRFLMAEAGVLLSTVQAIQSRADSYDFLLINAGFTDLMRPSLYGSYHEISIYTKNGEEIKERPLTKYAVAGPLCESGDVYTQEEGGIVTTRVLPKAKIGDLLVVHTTGAYGASMSSNYNSRPLAAEVLIENVVARLIRRRQTIEELMALEIFE